MARPGTNLAITSELIPQRSKRDCVWLTQESGSRDIRHSSLQHLDAVDLAHQVPTAVGREAGEHATAANSGPAAKWPSAAIAPATIRVG